MAFTLRADGDGMTDVAPLSPEELAEARKRHVPIVHWVLGEICEWCATPWPCDAARAIATVDAAVRREQVLRDYLEQNEAYVSEDGTWVFQDGIRVTELSTSVSAPGGQETAGKAEQ